MKTIFSHVHIGNVTELAATSAVGSTQIMESVLTNCCHVNTACKSKVQLA